MRRMRAIGGTKRKLLLLGLLALGTLGAVLTVAFSVAQSEWVKNTLLQAELDTAIEEHVNADDWIKEVKVVNSGKSPAFIRVRILVSPEGVLGSVIHIKEDATNRDPKWQDGGDGFLYYTEALAPDGAKSGTVMRQLEYLGGADYNGSFQISVYHEAVVATVAAGETASVETIKSAFDQAGQPVAPSP